MNAFFRPARLVAVLAVAGVGWSAAPAEELDPAARAAIRQLRSLSGVRQLDVLKELQRYPSVEAAKAIVPLRLADPAPQVRQAAYETLLAWQSDRAVTAFLLKYVATEKGTRRSVVPLLSAALLTFDAPSTLAELDKALAAHLTPPAHGVLVTVALAEELSSRGDPRSIRALGRLIRLKCIAGTFACRRAAVQSLLQIRAAETIDELLVLLPELTGEVLCDAVRYLGLVSGEQHGGDVAGWKAWWSAHRAGFKFPEKWFAQAPGAPAPAPPADRPSYYGLSVYAGRVMFVIDVSGSMQGRRLDSAKRELLAVIDALPETTSLNIVAFSTYVQVWQPRLVPATASAKQFARAYVSALQARGETAAFDALEAAFRFDVEAIYFLTDGQPNAGKISNPASIVAAVTQANRTRRISLYTIGIAPPPDSVFEVFVSQLAYNNWGIYRRAD